MKIFGKNFLEKLLTASRAVPKFSKLAYSSTPDPSIILKFLTKRTNNTIRAKCWAGRTLDQHRRLRSNFSPFVSREKRKIRGQNSRS